MSSTSPDTTRNAPNPQYPRVIALLNQKGGVGKTTSTVNLGAALAQLGKRTLLIDLDPQAHLSLHLGINPEQLEHSVYDLMVDEQVTCQQVMVQVSEHLSVLPAHVNLAGAETELGPKMATGMAQRILKQKCGALLGSVSDAKREGGVGDGQAGTHGPGFMGDKGAGASGVPFDYILIDCPPSLGLLTINALSFAQEIIVPMQAHFLALQGLSKLLETAQLIEQSFNADLKVAGVILCMHENQTLLAQEVISDLKAFFESGRQQQIPWRDAAVFEPAIRRNIKLAECPSFGQSIFDYEPGCRGAQDYLALAKTLISSGSSDQACGAGGQAGATVGGGVEGETGGETGGEAGVQSGVQVQGDVSGDVRGDIRGVRGDVGGKVNIVVTSSHPSLSSAQA